MTRVSSYQKQLFVQTEAAHELELIFVAISCNRTVTVATTVLFTALAISHVHS